MMNNFSRDRILEAIGLETKRTTTDIVLPAVGIFAAGILVGAGLGLLFAPRSGQQLRNQISSRVSNLRNRAEQMVEDVEGAHH